MGNSFKKRTALCTFCSCALAACSNEATISDMSNASSDPAELTANLETAEGMIDAFYSFDPNRLQRFLSQAGEAEAGILSYQAWAEGGNYIVLNRMPCASEDGSANKINCPITVQDDPVQALETGFDVTDTFHLTFEDGTIVDVDTSSNDQPIYYEARQWVEANLPEVMEGPCRRDEDGIRITPGDCARAMTEGYRQYKQYLDAMDAEADQL